MVLLKCRIMSFDVEIDIFRRLTFNFNLAANVLLLNKTQEEYNFTTFDAIFGLEVNDVKRLKS